MGGCNKENGIVAEFFLNRGTVAEYMMYLIGFT